MLKAQGEQENVTNMSKQLIGAKIRFLCFEILLLRESSPLLGICHVPQVSHQTPRKTFIRQENICTAASSSLKSQNTRRISCLGRGTP